MPTNDTYSYVTSDNPPDATYSHSPMEFSVPDWEPVKITFRQKLALEWIIIKARIGRMFRAWK